MAAGQASLLAALACALQGWGATPPYYVVDRSWTPAFPAGTDLYSGVAVAGDRVFVAQRDAHFADPVLVFDRQGKLVTTWGGDAGVIGKDNGTLGSHGLGIQPADPDAGRPEATLWMMDFFNHAVLAYSLDGKLLGKAGRADHAATSGASGFGKVSDVAFRGGSAFFADGDGGDANRVERWSAASGIPEKVEWVWPSEPPSQRKNETYSNPHGITYHERSDCMLVADREHGRIAVVDPETGVPLGDLQCADLNLGPMDSHRSAPFGVRTLRTEQWDLLLVAASDSPADQKNQFVHIVDMASFSRDHLGCKAVVQSMAIAPPGEGSKNVPDCNTPHLIGVDHQRGDIYLSCIGQPGSNIIRLRQLTPGERALQLRQAAGGAAPPVSTDSSVRVKRE